MSKKKLTIKISEPLTPKEFGAYFLLRYTILRKPWNKPLGSEKDEQENECIHIIASNENKEILGVCRLQFNSKEEAQIRFMAVLEEFRGNNVGRKLLDYAEKKSKSKGAKKVILHARSTAVNFYKKCNYSEVEKSYLMWGEIQHYLMQKQIV